MVEARKAEVEVKVKMEVEVAEIKVVMVSLRCSPTRRSAEYIAT